ncbi:hypothetical protein HN51_030268 [Arachis hypogaea]
MGHDTRNKTMFHNGGGRLEQGWEKKSPGREENRVFLFFFGHTSMRPSFLVSIVWVLVQSSVFQHALDNRIFTLGLGLLMAQLNIILTMVM